VGGAAAKGCAPGPVGHEEMLLWRRGCRLLAGADEAGRGPLAGPVVAAAVMLRADWPDPGVDDSKRLSAARREFLAERIKADAAGWAVAVVEADEIDRLNIHNASLLAMSRAVEQLRPRPDFLLVDGRSVTPLDLPQKAVVGGDASCRCIAAASILAKVWRDGLMARLHERWPQYNFAANKGYPTPQHKAALARFGPCPIHRRSYADVAQMPLAWGDA